MADEIIWEDPPEKRGLSVRTSKWDETLTTLKEHPGKWAKLQSGKGSGSWFKNKGFEVAQRTTPEGVATYVRWPDEVAAESA